MTSQGHAYARFQHALKIGNAHIALAAAADLKRDGLTDALSLLLLIREDEPVLYDKAAVRWFARYAAEDRYLLLRDARELIDLLDGVGLASPSTRRTICATTTRACRSREACRCRCSPRTSATARRR